MYIAAVHTPHAHQTHPSPRSRELAGQLRAAIAAYRRDHPKLTTSEIVAALHSVRELEVAAAAGTRPVHPVRVVSTILLAFAAVGATIWLLNANKHGEPLVWPLIALTLPAAIVVVIAFTLWRDR